MRQPTIFVTSFHPLIARNLFSTGLVAKLTGEGIRVCLIVPDYKRAYFESAYHREGVRVIGVVPNQPTRSRLGLLFKRLEANMLDTTTVAIQQRYKRDREGKRLYYYGFLLPARLLGKSVVLLRFVRWLDYHVAPQIMFRDLLLKERPDLVFASDVQNENDVALMQAARHLGIATIAMVRSWDNPTQFPMRFFPDRLLVANHALGEEVTRFHGFDSAFMSVVGVPHYDRYRSDIPLDRARWFLDHGFDPVKPLIFFAPVGDIYIEENRVDRSLIELFSSLGVNCFVRFPPNDTVRCLDGVSPPPRMVFDRPGVPFAEKGPQIQELNADDDARLVSALAACDVVVSGTSTILVDAMVFRKPAILVALDSVGGLAYIRSVLRYLDYNHIRRLVDSRAVRVSKTLDEVRRAVVQYIADPREDEAARARFVRAYQGDLGDARATERLVSALIDFIPSTH